MTSQSHPVFQQIADDVVADGFSIQTDCLDPALSESIFQEILDSPSQSFQPAGIGRASNHIHNTAIRRDKIRWIEGETDAQRAWLAWASALQTQLNQSLFLGLNSFESHFAYYQPGDFYQRHVDAFRGQRNRILSVVAYFNPEWSAKDGGELVLFLGEDSQKKVQILPQMGSVAVFLSEEFPHEVLPASRDRFSIAGWFRIRA